MYSGCSIVENFTSENEKKIKLLVFNVLLQKQKQFSLKVKIKNHLEIQSRRKLFQLKLIRWNGIAMLFNVYYLTESWSLDNPFLICIKDTLRAIDVLCFYQHKHKFSYIYIQMYKVNIFTSRRCKIADYQNVTIVAIRDF